MERHQFEKEKDIQTVAEATKNVLDLVVAEMVRSNSGRNLLRFFIDEAVTYTIHPDDRVDVYERGRRSYGLQLLQILRANHPEMVVTVLQSQ